MTHREKPYHKMTDAELHEAMATWGKHVEDAPGWPSAYFAASQCKAIESIAKKRGLSIENKWPIKVG